MADPDIAYYYLAVGDDASKCVRLSLSSLRRAGFDGSCYILTDKQRDTYDRSSDLTHEVVLRPSHLNLDPNSTAPEAEIDIRTIRNTNPYKFGITYLTPTIAEYVDIQRHDYVVFLDADILVTQPLDGFHRLLAQGDSPFGAASNRVRIGDGKPNHANLTRRERRAHKREPAICSCLVYFTGDAAGVALLDAWKDECRHAVHGDQAALQAVVIRKYRDRFRLLPYSVLGYGPGWKAYQKGGDLTFVDSVFVHFQGAIRHPQAMEDYNRLFGIDAVR